MSQKFITIDTNYYAVIVQTAHSIFARGVIISAMRDWSLAIIGLHVGLADNRSLCRNCAGSSVREEGASMQANGKLSLIRKSASIGIIR